LAITRAANQTIDAKIIFEKREGTETRTDIGTQATEQKNLWGGKS